MPSPPYVAEIECEPTDKPAIVNVAAPPLTVPVPKTVAPSINVTVPVDAGRPPGVITVALNVTDCPKTLGLTELLSVVWLAALFTVCVSDADVLVVNDAAPA